MINTMESEIYNEIAELKSRKSEIEAGIVDWFENCEDNKDTTGDYGATGWDALDLGSRNRKVCKSSNLFNPT